MEILLDTIRDSVETSVSMKLFKNMKDASYSHLFFSQKKKLSMRACASLENFDNARLQASASKAYPPDNRPRGQADISSVNFFVNHPDEISPIWILQKGHEQILLDGAHRIVAAHILGKNKVDAYVINTP